MKNDKVKTLGNYSPSEFNASKIVDVEYSAPTVRENHGTVTAIVDDTYRNRSERVYEDASPSLRAGRSGLKVANNLTPKVIGGIGNKCNNDSQYHMQNRIYEPFLPMRVSNLTTLQKLKCLVISLVASGIKPMNLPGESMILRGYHQASVHMAVVTKKKNS